MIYTDVQNYGTIFNIKSYPVEKVLETKLLKGLISVKIKNKFSEKVILKPTEQIYYYNPAFKED